MNFDASIAAKAEVKALLGEITNVAVDTKYLQENENSTSVKGEGIYWGIDADPELFRIVYESMLKESKAIDPSAKATDPSTKESRMIIGGRVVTTHIPTETKENTP